MTTRETLKAIHDRGDLLPWLNGETECLCHGGLCTNPQFTEEPSTYTFRPIPKATLRPWTAEELWQHRDCWFRRKDGLSAAWRPTTFGEECLLSGIAPSTLLETFEYTADGETWQACGVMETAQ